MQDINFIGSNIFIQNSDRATNITLSNRTSAAIWDEIYNRLEINLSSGLINSTGNTLAIQALNNHRQSQLLLSLLKQLNNVLKRLSINVEAKSSNEYGKEWMELQEQISKQALRSISGNYLRIPYKGKPMHLGENLINQIDTFDIDEELPSYEDMLDPLFLDKPVYVNGKFLSADDPRALMHLETYFQNWIIRTADLISSEILQITSNWPELRNYMLKEELVSTREHERFRNQLNSELRWRNLIERPIRLYESKRLIYKLSQGQIIKTLKTESRDEELKQLSWPQQQVTLLVETRDAIAPQLQSLIKHIGDVMVLILTKVIGRSIGLIGRGIAQGMGKSLKRG